MSETEMTGNLFLYSTNAAPAHEASALKPEAVIVGRIRGGERDAFAELYKMFAPLVHGIVLSKVPRDEADDIAQEVFLAAYKNIDALRDPNSVGAWLSMIARNQATEFYRRAKPTEELPEEIRQKESSVTEAREILDAIKSLPDAYGETLVLRLVEGLTGQEIAEQTGLTAESVRVNLHRGMKMLRQTLGIKEKSQ
jgi:RNA polymerase sigma-70 factor (ECF subfamily)